MNKENQTKAVTVISIWSKIDGLEGVAAGRTNNVTYEVQVPVGDTVIATLENAFHATNRDDRPLGRQVCSTSTGDILVLDGQHYLVEGHGYHALTQEESVAAQRLTSRDTGRGYKWLFNRAMFPAH